MPTSAAAGSSVTLIPLATIKSWINFVVCGYFVLPLLTSTNTPPFRSLATIVMPLSDCLSTTDTTLNWSGVSSAIAFIEILKGKVLCVSYYDRADKVSYTVSKKDGIDPHFLMTITDQYGSIDKGKAREAGYVIEDGNAWISKEADILIPAALEGQINAETIKMISPRVKIIAEGANGPTTPEADEVIKQKGIFIIPDFLCNSGGVTVSYFESVQNDMNYYWTKEEVLEKP